ncbi:hypothetical protein Esti_004816 [Eimeria stiedai]
MCDNLDAFLEDIISLPRWVNRSLCLLRELDLRSQACGEEAQRRRSRYLALARTKLSAANSSTVPTDFYDDPELVSEAKAARDRGREAHALMKEKLVVVNQLIRILRGETESFKVSLARFAREVGGEDALRHSRRKAEGSSALSYGERVDEGGVHGSASPAGLGGFSQHSARPTAARSRVAAVSSAGALAARAEHGVGLVAAAETPSGPEALSALPHGLASSISAASRSRPSKKAAIRGTGSATGLAADGARPARRPKARPTAVTAPAKIYQEGTLYEEAGEGFVMQVQTGAAKEMAPPLLPVEGGHLCSGSSVGSQQGLPGSRVKRAKQPADASQDLHSVGNQSSHVLPCETQRENNKLSGGRAARAANGRAKKSREALPSLAFAASGEAAKPAADAVVANECLEGIGAQPAGLLIRLPPTLPLPQQPSAAKDKSSSERTSSKQQPARPLAAARLNNPRVTPGLSISRRGYRAIPLIAPLLVLASMTASGVRLSDKLLLTFSPNLGNPRAGVEEHAELAMEEGLGEEGEVPSDVHDDVPSSQSDDSSEQPSDLSSEDTSDEGLLIHFEVKTRGHLQAVSASMKGRRPTDEDELTTLEQLNSNTYFLGLFDGHGGSETSKYLRDNAHVVIAEAIDASQDAPLEVDEEKIVDACINLDRTIVSNDICKESGSTAAMLLIEHDILAANVFKLHSIYVGDSRIMVFNFDGSPTTLTQDHKPNLPEEVARIRAAGQEVVNVGGVWRVGGSLAISRAFGDPMFKDYDTRPDREQPVAAVPGQQTKSVPVTSLILLACDGLFETVNTDVEQVLRSALEESHGGVVEAIRKLILTAYDRGSGDNISVIVAMMHPEPLAPSSRRFSRSKILTFTMKRQSVTFTRIRDNFFFKASFLKPPEASLAMKMCVIIRAAIGISANDIVLRPRETAMRIVVSMSYSRGRKLFIKEHKVGLTERTVAEQNEGTSPVIKRRS